MGLFAHVGSGVFEPLQVIGVTAFGAAYALRAATLAREGRPVPMWRLTCYFSGLALILVAFVSPVAHLGGELVLAHMVQHLIIGDIAALLIVLGLTRAVLAPVMALKAFDRLRFLTLPTVALPLWIVNFYVWHIPALYDATVSNELVHALQHACFIGFGVLMWMPIAGPLPVPSWFGGGAQVGYTAIARLAMAGLGNILMWSGTVLYTAAEGLRALAVLLSPVMPVSTEKLWIALGAAESVGRLQDQPIRDAGAWGVLKPGTSVNGLAPLFPRVEQSV